MADNLRISLIQGTIAWENVAENLSYYGRLLRRVKGKADIAVLPETFSTGFTMHVEPVAEAVPGGNTVAMIKQWASSYDMAIAGSFIAVENGNYYNRGFFITPEGEEYYYNKRHLFRMGSENKHFTSGDKRLILSYKGWNICLLICYDLRFPVWSRNVNNEYDVLIYCANWPQPRIEVWKTLLQARAIENMCYVCGVNRVGEDGVGAVYSGESMILSPKGKKLAYAGMRKNTTCTYTLNKKELTDFRAKFPCWADMDSFTIL